MRESRQCPRVLVREMSRQASGSTTRRMAAWLNAPSRCVKTQTRKQHKVPVAEPSISPGFSGLSDRTQMAAPLYSPTRSVKTQTQKQHKVSVAEPSTSPGSLAVQLRSPTWSVKTQTGKQCEVSVAEPSMSSGSSDESDASPGDGAAGSSRR